MSEEQADTYDLFCSYAEADRAWVEGYLLDGLIQAGLRVHSEAAFRLGVPRLLEFERAIQGSQRVLLVLSPAYLASSFGQFADLLAQSYGLETATWPVIPLVLKAVELPPRLAMLQALDACDPAEWPEVLERLCAELQRPVPGLPARPPCPYPGMVPFGEGDRDRFFGREAEVEVLLKRLRLHPFLAVIGPSGSGKSSLVFAGLVPALRASDLFGPGSWRVRRLRPGGSAWAVLADALEGDPGDPARAVSGLLAARPGTRRLLVVVDQFEELFTRSPSDAEAFQQALLSLARVPDCTVVVAVRADFYPDLMASPLWGEIQAHRVEVLPLDGEGLRQAIVRPAESAGVFVETALVERLVADAAGEPGILPFVQETLVLLWDRVERRYLPLRAYEALILAARSYRELGDARLTGLQVAMADRAEAALQALPPVQRTLARRIFLRLVHFGQGRADTRRQQRVDDLRSAGDDPALFEATLAHLTNHRLLTLSGAERFAQRQVDIAHEALIAGWPTLRGWLAERREAEQGRRRLEAKAAEWARLGRGSGGLLDEVELLEAERWLAGPDAAELGSSQALPALVAASRRALDEAARQREAALQRELAQAQALADEAEARRAAEAQRAREAEARQRAEEERAREAGARVQEQARSAKRLLRLVVGLAGVALLAAGAASLALYQSRVATARQLTAQARAAVLEEQFELATLLALEANRLDSREGAEVLRQIPYLARLVPGQHLVEGWAEVNSVAFSPDGRTLASASSGEGVTLWDTETRKAIAALQGPDRWVKSVAWHPDGHSLASGGSEDRVTIWDAATGEAVATLEGHEDWVTSVAWRPDGWRLASGSSDQRVIVWSVETGQALATLEGHSDSVYSVAWHPEGRYLASASADGRVIVWDVDGGAALATLEGHTAGVNAVAWQPGGHTLASGADDGRVIIWRADPGEGLATLETGAEAVQSLAWHPDGRTLASGLDDGRVILWDVESGQVITTLEGHTHPVIYWDPERGEGRASLHGARGWRINGLAWHPDGRQLASGDYDGRIIVWDAGDARAVTILEGHAGRVSAMAWHPGGHTLASGAEDGEVIVWDAETGAALATLRGHSARVNGLAWHPEGRILASAADDDRILVRDAETARTVTTLEDERYPANGVAWHPEGRVLATAGSWGKVVLWDVEALTATALAGPARMTSTDGVAWHPNGTLLASAYGSRNQVIVWDVETGQVSAILEGREDDVLDDVLSIAWHPDGRTLASGSAHGRVLVSEVETGRVLTSLKAHESWAPVSGLAWRPDGRILASAADGGPVILFDADSGEAVTRLDGSGSVAWHPGGRTLAVASGAAIHLWPRVYAQAPCQWLTHNLSADQWRYHLGLAVYHATCEDLPVPEELDLELTLSGRLLLLGGALLLVGVLYLLVRAGVWLARRKRRGGGSPGPARRSGGP